MPPNIYLLVILIHNHHFIFLGQFMQKGVDVERHKEIIISLC